MTNEQLVYCYNKGCKHKKFDLNCNPPDSIECVYHPGHPIFHDAMKIWSCCNKKSHDFTEFLDIKGCAKGPHNPVKPPEPVKQQAPADSDENTASNGTEKRSTIMKAAEREPVHTIEGRLIDLPVTISASLQDALAKLAAENALASSKEDTVSDKVIEKGAACKNRGCTKTYQSSDDVDDVALIHDEDDDDPENSAPKHFTESSKCVHHPGVPVFHEGMKYWSCCQRKTTEFDVFLSQEGCETGEHNWLHKGERVVKQNSCRSDFHQTTNLLTLNFYAKLCDPSRSRIRASSTEVDIHLEFDNTQGVLDRRLQLFGAIDPSKSCVKIGAKVELLLAKLDKMAWPRLEYVPPQPPPVAAESTDDAQGSEK